MINNDDSILKTNATEGDAILESNVGIPNKDTIEAIKEAKSMLHDPSAPKYSSIEDLEKALDV